MDGRLPGDREVTGRQNPAYRPARLPLPLPFGGKRFPLRLGSRRYPGFRGAGCYGWGGAPPECLLGSRGTACPGCSRWCALVLRGHSAVSPPHGRTSTVSPGPTGRRTRFRDPPAQGERGRGGVSPQDERAPPRTAETCPRRASRGDTPPRPREPARTATDPARPPPGSPHRDGSRPAPARATAGGTCRSGGGPRRCRPRSTPRPTGRPPRVPCGTGLPAGRPGPAAP